MKKCVPLIWAIAALVASKIQAHGQTSTESDLRTTLTIMRSQLEAQQAQIEAMREQIEAMEKRLENEEQPSSLTPAPDTESSPIVRAEQAPFRRMHTSPRSAIEFEIYGYLKADASYDSQRTSPGTFAFFVQPESGDGDDDAFNMTVRQTRLGIQLKSAVKENWNASGRLEIDFFGGGSETAANPRIRLANAVLTSDQWSFLAGQAYDVWNTVLPKTVNFATQGRHGSLWSRRPQVHAAWKSQDFAAVVGLAHHIGLQDLFGDDGLPSGIDYPLPLAQFNLIYTPDFPAGKATFALGGHFGKEEFEVSPVLTSEEFTTSLAIFSFQVPVTSKFKFLGTVWTGENLGAFQGGIGYSINAAKNTEVQAGGGWVQFQYQLKPDLLTTFTYGIDDPRDADLNPGDRSLNQSFAANLFWTILPSTTLAFEYQYLLTDYLEMDDVAANRIQSSLIFKF